MEIAQMPDKPSWYANLETAIEQLASMPAEQISRSMIESALKVRRRRAQQILQPFVQHSAGRTAFAPKEVVLRHLRTLSASAHAQQERFRRAELRKTLDYLQSETSRQPPVFTEAPVSIVNQELESLPPGVLLSPGRIVLEGFSDFEGAKQQLLALIMAMSNDPNGFEQRISSDSESNRNAVAFTV